jgi:DNA-binding beta-propeller fold protein YncE
MTRIAWLHAARPLPLALVAAVGLVLASTAGAQTPGAALGSGRNGAADRAVPQFEPDPLWSEALPNNWVTGAVGGVAVDSRDHVWVLHRPASIPDGEKAASLDPPQAECCIPAPPVLEFGPDGKFLQAWGGPGDGYEWFTTEHGIFVDGEDNVWLSGSAKEDNQILKFTRAGKLVMQIGRAGKNSGSNDRENLGGPAGLFVHAKTNELFVADGYFNHRVVVFDATTGAYKRHWGAYGNAPVDDYAFPPRAQLVQGTPPRQFNNPVHAVIVSRDDLVYVADRTNNRLQVFNLDGTFVREAFIARGTLQAEGTVHHFALSPDEAQRFLYVVDGSNKAVRVLDRATLEIVAKVGGRAGHNAREFFHIHSVAVDSNGNLFLGEVNTGQRYYRWAFDGMRPADSRR